MKRIIRLLCAALICLTAAGCGVEETPELTVPETVVVEVPFESTAAEKIYQDQELCLYAMVTETDPQAGVITQAAQMFERQTGAKVEVIWHDGSEDFLERALNSAEKIDIFQATDIALAQEYPEYAMDLTDMAKNADYESKSFGALRQLVIEECGGLAGIPQIPYLGGIYYNREVFEDCGIYSAPENWEEFTALCQTLVNHGWQPLAMDQEDALCALELHLERKLSESFWMPEDPEAKWKWADSEPAVEALGQLAEFARGGFLAYQTPAEFPGGQNKLALSNAAMMVGTNGTCRQVENATLTDLSWGMFPWPGAGDGCGSYVACDVLAVHKDSENAQAAFDFIMLLTTGEFDQLRADVAEGIPADPGNRSVISGAVETLRAARPRRLSLPDSYGAMAIKLWEGRYENGALAALIMDAAKG